MLANPQLGNSPAPIEDGNVLPVNSIAALAAGNYRKVPMIAGNTKDEGTLFANLFGSFTGTGIPGFKPNDYDRFGLQFDFDPDAPATLTEADLINAAYLPVTATPTGWNALSEFAGNSIFLGPVVPQLNSLTGQQPTQVWYYRFEWNEEPAPFNTVYGATHGNGPAVPVRHLRPKRVLVRVQHRQQAGTRSTVGRDAAERRRASPRPATRTMRDSA